MPGPTISSHEVAVYRALAYRALTSARSWLSSAELAARAGVVPRTARHHALRLVRLGIVEQAAVFPGHRYRLAEEGVGDTAYLARLLHAAEVLGVDIPREAVQ